MVQPTAWRRQAYQGCQDGTLRSALGSDISVRYPAKTAPKQDAISTSLICTCNESEQKSCSPGWIDVNHQFSSAGNLTLSCSDLILYLSITQKLCPNCQNTSTWNHISNHANFTAASSRGGYTHLPILF